MRLNHWLYTVPLRWRSLFRRTNVEQELDDELQYHVDQKTQEYIRQGMPADEARYRALRDMHGLEQRKEECRDARGVNTIENLLRDLRGAFRVMAKAPGFTAVAVVAMALGIGANTAIFTVVNAVLLHPLPYPESDRIVQVMLYSPSWAMGKNFNLASVPEFITWREQTHVFQEIAGYDYPGLAVNLTGGEKSEQLKALHVSADYFRIFAAPIQVGRTFSADEDRPGGSRTVVISNGLWLRRFGGDRSIVGRAILLAGEPHVVVGVLGPDFFPPDPLAEIWLPLKADPNSTFGGHNIRVVGRLNPGVTLDMAKAKLKLAYEEFQKKFPSPFPERAVNKIQTFTAEPLQDAIVGDVRPALLVLTGAVGFVLLIACANVANLLLARATVRKRELAIRATLGAGRRRIVLQLLIESIALSLLGGALGLPVGYISLHALLASNPGAIPRINAQSSAIGLDWQILAFTISVSLFTGILFGILPALIATQTDFGATLTESTPRSGTSLRRKRSHSAFVIIQVGLSVVLLVGAGLLIRTFQALRSVDPGFNVRNVLTMEMSLGGPRFQTTSAVSQVIRDAERRVENLPGVIALAATYSLPLEGTFGGPFTLESHPNEVYGADIAYVSRHYFEVLGIPLLRGRLLGDGDDGDAAPVALINEALAKGSNEKFQWSSAVLWHNNDPVGDRITVAKDAGPPFADRTRQIIGVVGGVRDTGLNHRPQPLMYLPISQTNDMMTAILNGGRVIIWAIRTRTEPLTLRADIERELRTASGGLPVAHIRPMDQVIIETTARDHLNMVLLSAFAGVALFLAAIGVYGVMAYAVQQRWHEMGVRIALGARPGDVRAMVVREGMRLALVGIIIGVVGSMALTPLMSSLLFGVEAVSLPVLACVAAMLGAVAFLATYIPAHRATRVDPVLVLRWE